MPTEKIPETLATPMLVAYIAHPISGDKAYNLEKIKKIVRGINIQYPHVVPFVPYYADCLALDDDDSYERARGIINDIELLSRGFVDELWLFGPKISNGMWAEIKLAASKGIRVVPQTKETHEQYLRVLNLKSEYGTGI